MFATLKRTRMAFTGCLDLYRHWARVLRQPSINVSGSVISLTPIRMKRKLTDIVPLNPGKLTLSPETRIATVK
jgi:hypothetical protein